MNRFDWRFLFSIIWLPLLGWLVAVGLGKYGFFVMRDDQMLSSGYIVFDAFVFP